MPLWKKIVLSTKDSIKNKNKQFFLGLYAEKIIDITIFYFKFSLLIYEAYVINM